MATSLNASLNVQLNPQSLNQASRQVQHALGRITGQASEFQKSLDASTARVFAFGATTAVLNGVTQSFKKLIAVTIEVEKRLIEINSIFQASEASFNKFRNSIFQVAKETGQSFNTVAEGAAELARQGLSAEETATRLKAALVMTRISGMDAEKSVKSLTAAINGFSSAGLTANSIVNKMVAVDTAFAVSTQDLADAFSRAGSTAEDAGVSFDQLLGLVTAVEQKTARGGAVIGNAFKSIFTRLQRGTTIEKLRELGVEIDATQTGISKLYALSNAIENIADPSVVSQIKELAGGVFQINVVSAALKDLSSETSVFAKASQTAAGATNEAFEKNEALGESLAHNINALVIGLTSLAEKVGGITFGPLLENLVGLADKVSGFFDKALDPEKGNVFIKGFFKAIGSFLSGPALVIFTAAFAKISQLVAKFAVEGIKALFTMGTQADRIRQIEGGIVGLLQRDESLRNQIASSATTQAQKEQLIINAIKQENMLLQQQAALMRSLATASAARGVTGFGGAGFTGRRGRFSAGFRAEEAEARMRGAPAGVRGRYSAGTIGGRKFIMNSHETEVPRFGRNGDSAVIPHYARGFVPNYAAQRVLSTRGRPKKNIHIPAPPNPINVRAGNYAFLVPSRSAGEGANNFRTGSTDKIGGTKYRYNITDKVRTFSPAMRRDQIDKNAEPYDSQIEKKISRSISKSALDYAQLLVIPKGVNQASEGDINKRLGQGGQKGAYGAIRGAVGAAFEAAVFSALGLEEFQAARGGADWDVRNLNAVGNGEVAQTFKTGAMAYGDMKVGATQNTVDSFIGKILRHNPSYKDDMVAYKKRITAIKKAKGGKAAGFIPNYAGRAVPTSRMRIHRNDNGSPLAVTNTRDEPPNSLAESMALEDAIGREKKGIGMSAARGFVPNYLGERMTRAQLLRTNSRAMLDFKPLKNQVKSTETAMSGLDGKTMGLMLAFSSLQTILGMFSASTEEKMHKRVLAEEEAIKKIKESNKAYSEQIKMIQAQKDQTSALADSSGGLDSFGKALNETVTLLMGIQALNLITGSKLSGLMAVPLSKFGLGKRARVGERQRLMERATTGKKALSREAAKPRVAKQMKVSGAARGLGVAGAAYGAFNIFKDLRDARLNAFEKQEKVSRGAGALALGIGGAKAGAMAGAGGGPVVSAIVGLVVGVIGAMIGGAAGGALGGNAELKTLRATEEATNYGRERVKFGRGMRMGVDDRIEGEYEAISDESYQNAINKSLDFMSRGIDPQKWRMASDKDQEKLLETHEKTVEGEEKAQRVLAEFIEARAHLTKVLKNQKNAVGIGDFDEAEVAEAKEQMAEKERAIRGRVMDSYIDEMNWRNRLKLATSHLSEAQDKLANFLNDYTGIGQALKLEKRSQKELSQAELMTDIAPSIGGKYASGLQETAKQAAMLREINVLNAQKKGAEITLDVGMKDGLPQGKLSAEQADVLKKAAAEAGEALVKKARVAGVYLANKVKEIGDLQLENAKQRDALSSQRIKQSIDQVTKIQDADTEAIKMDAILLSKLMKGYMKTGEGAGEIAQRFGEYDDQGIKGLEIDNVLSKLMNRSLQEVQKLIAHFTESVITQGGEKNYTKYGDDMGDMMKLDSQMVKGGLGDPEEDRKLKEKTEQLAALMKTTLDNWQTFSEGPTASEEGKDIGQTIVELQRVMETASTSLSGFENFNADFGEQTASTAKLIGEVSTLNDEAVVVVKRLRAEVDSLADNVATIMGEPREGKPTQ